jgi:hypothetical protein
MGDGPAFLEIVDEDGIEPVIAGGSAAAHGAHFAAEGLERFGGRLDAHPCRKIERFHGTRRAMARRTGWTLELAVQRIQLAQSERKELPYFGGMGNFQSFRGHGGLAIRIRIVAFCGLRLQFRAWATENANGFWGRMGAPRTKLGKRRLEQLWRMQCSS